MTMTNLVRTGVGLAVLLAASTASAQRGAAPAAPNVFRGDGLLLTQGPGSHIGVTVREVESTDAAAAAGGVVITEVRPDTPAAAAGLRVSDVVVEFDGERVRSIRQFARLVQETPPGRQVRAAIVRDGRREELNITPAESAGIRPFVQGSQPFAFSDDRMRELMDGANQLKMFTYGAPRLGVTVQEMTTDLATYFGAKEGVLVSSVTDGSAAARAGLRAGDVITSAAGQPVRSQADLSQALRNASGPVALGVVRDKQAITINVDMAAVTRPLAPTLQLRRGQVI